MQYASEKNHYAEVMRQEHAKPALEIAASGGHNSVMIGPRDSGKTMLERLSTILIQLNFISSPKPII